MLWTSTQWEYFFLPQAHRLAIFEDANTSSSQIAYFFEDALIKVYKVHCGFLLCEQI